MALGFGFNKAKVLASAEKFVQQGKLHPAIAEYEKIVEKDAKDLTVLNTIGDLYARLGQNEKAGEFFKRVGDTYASDGFTVKAIAMYKKLTKLNPGNITVVQRLAELYTQQGLYNDARQQYLQLADGCVKGNDLNGAIKVFKKMLEIDPDNVSLQSKLADLHLKMGHKEDARDIFLKAAQSLFDRGSVEQADQALERMLAIDPSNIEALMMRGKIALDGGDGASAARYFEKVPDIDSRQEGLQSLMRAYILASNAEGAEGIARKLATVHNDLGGIRSYADFLLANGNSDAALTIYDEWVDRLIVGDTGELTFALQGLTGQVKDNPASLERLRDVFQKAGATANIPEVNELLAHAYVQAGELPKARDLYKELAELEASNPLHMQNYRQVLARMGEEPTARPLAPSEASQALFVEEIEAPPPPSQPEYPASLMEKISNVLTDAELFESYNKPQQAVSPLEGVLEKAPKDVRINQRLLSVYGRLGRLEDAARCCDTLKSIYYQAEMVAEARKYSDMAIRFRERAGVPIPVEAPPAPVETPAATEPAADELTADAFATKLAPEEAPAIPMEMGEAHEIDLSSEWEAALSEPVAEVSPSEVPAPEPAEDVQPSMVSDLLEEIRFYISERMLDEARSAIVRCEQVAPASSDLAKLKEQLAAAESGAPAGAEEEVASEEMAAAVEEETGSEATVVEFDFAAATTETVAAAAEEGPPAFEVAEPEATVEEIEFEVVAEEQPEEAPVVEMEVAPPAQEEIAPEPTPEEVAVEEPVAAAQEWRAPEPEYVEEIPVAEVAPTEEPAEEVVAKPEPVAETPKPVEPAVTAPEPVLAEVATAAGEDVLSDFVLDLEESLPSDFGPPVPTEPEKAAAAVAGSTLSVSQPEPVRQIAASASVPSPAASVPAGIEPVQVASISEMSDTSSVLSDLFAEFKEEVGEQEEAEDPETHYNLGVAFKEMGLLDEAIGELQKVCKSIDRGTPFSQVMQAYTWLAGCFIEKGVPEAAIKWYGKALSGATNDESRTALHYDLASAYEASGDRQQALKHFMEVYGTNIDYRDVAERIKALKA